MANFLAVSTRAHGMRIAAVLASALLLASCWQEAPAPVATPTPSGTPTAQETPARPIGARAVVEETDDFRFEYSYPAEAGNIPELAALLDTRLDTERAELATQSAQARDEASDNGFPYNKYSSGVEWKVVADTPGFLSLSANLDSYTGGAHGNYGFDSIVWDKQAKRALKPESFFTSETALDEILGSRLCDLLNRERAVRRGAPVAEDSQDIFDQCVPLSDTTVLLGSTRGRAFDRIGVLIGPYVAGAYAEGSFEFTLPVDDQVLGVVKAEYRSAFATRN